MNSDVTYSVVIPVYNSVDSLRDLCYQITEVLSLSSFEIIFVDDGSTDGSWKLICELKKEYPKLIKAIQLQRNYGQFAATSCAFAFCTGEYVLTIDDDLQYAPADILTLVTKQKDTDADVVYGVQPRKKQSFVRNMAGRFVQFVSTTFEGRENRGSSFRLIKKKIYRFVAEHHAQSFISLDNIITWYTSELAFVEVAHHRREKGKSGYSLGKLIRLYLTNATSYSVVPLKLMTQGGFILAVVFFLRGLYFIYHKIVNNVQPGYTSIIVTILFCSSIIIFCLGVVGEYLYKIYMSHQNKPLYSIKNII